MSAASDTPRKRTRPVYLNPKIEMPPVNVEPIANALKTLANQQMQTQHLVASLVQENQQLMRAISDQNKLISNLMSREPVKPVVNLPTRPKNFYVSLDKEGDETFGFHIQAKT